ncbi:MAG: pantetheine-phosphate adenylyltransferase [Chitinophagales bacterium]|nr:pantetheine-phosphate adenylyltransferase [Chitinophagales bacterium]MDW8274080.1 pantetheine-phosphate adenylyltransferase [Chitinophagales bacterium]
MKKAVFPGSFDPITTGHVDIVLRALPLFDQIIVAIGENSQKQSLFPLEKRLLWIKKVFEDQPKILVEHFTGLTVNFCAAIGANYILRGIRSSSDFDYEKTIAHLNNAMYPEIETILILARPELSSVSSTIVREIIRGKGKVDKFVPSSIADELKML